MRGLEALVAAASAAGRNNLQNGQIVDNLIDPALKNMSDTTDALSRLFDDPAFLSAVQGHAFKPTSLYTQLFSNMLPSHGPNTPVQQTRSGRISRPPIAPPQHPLLRTLSGAETGFGGNQTVQGDATVGQSERGPFWHPHGQTNLVGLGQGKAASTRRKRSASTMEEEEDDTSTAASATPQPVTERDSGGEKPRKGLPPYPWPPSGPNSRKAMPRDEILARRRARNRVAAVESRKKKKEFMDCLEERLKAREDAYDELETHCQALEQEVQQLRAMLAGAGSLVPGTLPPSNMFSHMATPLNGMPSDVTLNSAMSTIIPPNLPTLPVIAQLSPPLDQTPMTFDETPIPSFDMFFNLDDDMDGEHDGDFLPTSSPKHDSSGESDFENETPSTSHKRKQKGKRKVQIQQDEDDEDDDFVDPEVEDEDMFLPIEDVPIPEDLKQDAMRSLGVDNQAQLVNLINKMVNAGQETMTSETVEKLKVLLTLVGPRGGWSG